MKVLDGRLKKLESRVESSQTSVAVDPDFWPQRVVAEGFTWDEMERQFGDIPGFAYWLMCKPSDTPVSPSDDPAEEYMRVIGK